jgi:DNA-binding NtrC family response regulator
MVEPAVRVLIVEDDPTYVDFVRSAFAQAEGVRPELTHVARLRDVLPALEKAPASVVLLDINLPDGNGLAWMRANRLRVDASVIVLTAIGGYAAGPDIVEGAQDFLVKSEVDPQQLVRAVQYAAERERERRELVRSHETSLLETQRIGRAAAHDIRTALAEVAAACEQLKEGLTGTDLAESPEIDIIRQSLERAQALVERLLRQHPDRAKDLGAV